MESHELRVFQAVAKAGSITKAAQHLGYVQSNLTARVQQLEAELNTQLFYRQRGMVLTPAGEELLKYAEQIIFLLDEASNAFLDSNSKEPTGRLVLGATHTASAMFLPSLLAEYSKLYPKVELSLTTGYSDELIDKIKHFQLHGALVKTEVKDENIIQNLVLEDELVLISPTNLEDIQSTYHQPFLMNTKGCPHREKLEMWLNSNGISSVRYLEFNHPDAIINGVVSGLGVSFVPKSSVKSLEQAGMLCTFEIPPEYSLVQTYFIRHKDSLLTSSLSRFYDMLVLSSVLK